ncbi:MAG: ADP-glyceromanno-heptose 6-epimerase [Betaproteobacteria bacterium]|jgi:ADP-L-glycero-D-manno-heptose 6-epimerase|nr:ADP-glyceromanno-heptose 6-epimerase [Rhodocyclaceae bacterium]MCA3146101.1 ADP-glyceromanno-heptose 6-epimerase [Rhodocyclaceae bacterium]MCE2897037.1 ADP-glyceromanno-heptose 6-epimerase [Betaproteobacteria bacterium]
MIIVTGAAGFIGANLVKALNARGETNILAVDNLTRADKFRNLADCDIADYWDKEAFLDALVAGDFDGEVDAVLHQGACSDTQGSDGRYMMDNNYRYTVTLLDWCQSEGARLIYASSAAVYGPGPEFREVRNCEQPLNVYGYSKFLADQVVRRRWDELGSQVAGLRYFNVYGPREDHKQRMASVAFHCFNQYRAEGRVKLFEGSGGYGSGEQQRDFVSVEDAVAVNLWLLDHPDVSGIFNVGTGCAQSFNDVAVAAVNALRAAHGEAALSLAAMLNAGLIEYTAFPPGLADKYQSFTRADLTQLRRAGYGAPFLTVEEGVARYMSWLLARAA